MCRLLLFALLGPLLVMGQYGKYKPVHEQELFNSKFTAASKQLQAMQADFIQEKNISLLSEKIVSKGKFWFKSPAMVRMEYLSPFRYLVIINHDKLYTRDGDKENRFSARSNKTFQQINQLMVDCIQGTVLLNPAYKMAVFQDEGRFLLELTPVTAGLKDYFKHILVYLSGKDFTVEKLQLDEQSGDNTLITFTNKEVNVSLAEGLFVIH